MATKIDNDPGAERLAGETGSRTARDQGRLIFPGVADERLDVFFVARDNNAERLDLEQGRIGAIQNARQVVEEEFPLDDSFEVVVNTFAQRGVQR